VARVQVDRVGLALRSDSHRAYRSRLFDLGWPVLMAASEESELARFDVLARIEHAEKFFGSLGATIRNGGNRAYYE